MCEIYKNLSLEDIQGEIWKDIPGYENSYQISNMGRVKSLPKKQHTPHGVEFYTKVKILKQQMMKNGYLVLPSFSEKTSTRLIHRLVALTFIPNENIENDVNHINEIKTDNRVENLEWMTHKENCNHGTRNKRTALKTSKPVLQYDLKGNFIKEWASTQEAGRNGYDASAVAKCCKNKYERRKNVYKNYIWKYKGE